MIRGTNGYQFWVGIFLAFIAICIPFRTSSAQTVSETRAPAPDIPSIIDQHGINLRSGMVSRDVELGRLGSGETAEQSVVANIYTQFSSDGGNINIRQRLNQEHTLQAAVRWIEEFGIEQPIDSTDYSVSGISGSTEFTRLGTQYLPKRNTTASLVTTNGQLNIHDEFVPDYEFIAQDGTVMTFAGVGALGDGPNGIFAKLTEKRKPNGEVLTYTYGGHSSINGGLSNVRSNLGYQVRIFDSNSIINSAHIYCAPTQVDCAALPNTPSSSSPWPNGTRMSDGNYSSASITDWSGDTTTFNATFQNEWGQYQINGDLEPRLIMDSLTIVSPGGVQKTYYYEFKNVVQNGVTLSGYDNKVERIEVHYAGSIWTYDFLHGLGADDWSKVTITSPTGEKQYFEFDKSDNLIKTKSIPIAGQELVTDFDYVAGLGFGYGRVEKITYPEGNTVNYTYDGYGRVTEVRQKDKPGSSLPDMVSSYSYVACNATTRKYCSKPVTFTNQRGLVTSYTYSSAHGGLTAISLPWASGTLRHKAKIEYAQFHAWYRTSSSSNMVRDSRPVWKVTKEIQCVVASASANCSDGDPNAKVTTYAYQSGNSSTPSNIQLVSTTTRSGDSSVSQTVTNSYDNLGRIRWTDGPIAGGPDRTWFEYNQRNQVTLETLNDPDGTGPQRMTYVETDYDADGRTISTENGWVTGASGARTFTKLTSTQNQYDTFGRLIKTSALDSGSNETLVTQMSYDSASREDCTALRMTPSTYSSLPSSACTQTSGTNDRISRQHYDAYGRPYKTTRGLGTSIEMSEEETFTTNGLRRTIEDGNGNLTTYEYDGHDRLFKVRYPNTSSSGSSTTDFEQFSYLVASGKATSLKSGHRHRDGQWIYYTYDAHDRVTFANAPGTVDDLTTTYGVFGDIQTRTKDGITLTTNWDALGRMTSEQGPLGTVSYEYDVASRKTRTTYPSGFYTTYNYVVAGGIDRIRENGSKVLANYDYDAFNRMTLLKYGNNIESDISYDSAGRVSDLDFSLPTASTYNHQVDFEFNPAGQITSKLLSNASYAPTVTSTSANYNINGLNQIASRDGTTFSYDPRGNLTSDGASSYSFNIFNQLTDVVGGSSYRFDPAGRLYQITSASGQVTRFQYDGADLIAEYDGSGQLLRQYVHGAGVDAPVVWYEGSATNNSTRRYLIPDERGSIALVTNNSGGVIEQNKYDAYGIPDPANLGRFQYTGQIWLDDVGLYHYKARAYDPVLGRFLQTDPIGYGDGLNMYAYVGNDPVNASDPTGMETTSCLNASENCTDMADLEFNETIPDYIVKLEQQAITALYGEGTTLEDLTKHKRYHGYANESTLCESHCNSALSEEVNLAMPAPRYQGFGGPVKDRPVQTGDTSNATSQVGEVIPIPGGPVTHIVGQSGSVANLTQQGHLLHRGYIIRWPEPRADGSIAIRTLGRGTGYGGGINNFSGRRIFRDLDNRARRVYNYREVNP